MMRSSFGGRRRAERRIRVGLWILAVGAAFPGAWALFASRSFFRDFPGVGEGWVSAFPPFNAHLIKDVGSFYLGFAVLLGAAAVAMDRRLTRIALVAWLVAAVPHFIFHAQHMDDLEGVDAVGQLSTLGLGVALPLLLLFWTRSSRRV
jgi:hypothetical protein